MSAMNVMKHTRSVHRGNICVAGSLTATQGPVKSSPVNSIYDIYVTEIINVVSSKKSEIQR